MKNADKLPFLVYPTEAGINLIVKRGQSAIALPIVKLEIVSELARELGEPMFQDIYCVALWAAIRWWKLPQLFKYVFIVNSEEEGYSFHVQPTMMPMHHANARMWWSRVCHSHLTSDTSCDTL